MRRLTALVACVALGSCRCGENVDFDVDGGVGGGPGWVAARGTFEIAATIGVGGEPLNVVVFDFDGDGRLDLATSNARSGDVTVLRGKGDGTFSSAGNFPAGAGASNLAAADVDGDGRPDLVTANNAEDTVSLLSGTGIGFASPRKFPTGGRPYSVAIADLNRDGRLDLVSSNNSAGTISVLLAQAAAGVFAGHTDYTVGSAPYNAAVGDVDGDGQLDVVAASFSGPLVVLRGLGAGVFGPSPARYAPGVSATWVQLGDLDEAGGVDIVVANFNENGVGVLLNDGAGSFGALTEYASTQAQVVALVDLDRDGHLDVVSADQGGNSVSIFYGDGTGALAPGQTFAAGNKPTSVAVGDFNGDGRPDLVVTNYLDDTVTVLLATPGP